MKIGNHNLDKNIFIIAELSCNHNQNLSTALNLIEKAHWAGANAIKIQLFKPEDMTIDCDNKYFRIQADCPWKGKKLYDLYKRAYMPWDWWDALSKKAQTFGMEFFASVFSEEGFQFLKKKKVPCYKIASFEAIDFPFIGNILENTDKPIIISTGIMSLDDLHDMYKYLILNHFSDFKSSDKHTIQDILWERIILLKCVSSYPTNYEEINLNDYLTLKGDLPYSNIIGLSDHTKDIYTAIASIPFGIKIIEKHLMLEGQKTLDDKFSLTPEEFKRMVGGVRAIEKTLNSTVSIHKMTEKQKENRKNFGRSLFAVENIKKGDFFTEENIRSIRPGDGMNPQYLKYIIGKKAIVDIKKGEPLKKEKIGW